MHARPLFALLVFLTTPSLAVDHPLEGDLLRLRDRHPVRRSVRLRAAGNAALGPAPSSDPRVAGATLEVVGRGPADGGSGVVPLDATRWTGLGDPPGSRGYRWLDRDRTEGVESVLFKIGRGGRLAVSGGGATWGYAVSTAQAGPIDVRLTIGADVYCARFADLQRNEPGTVVGKDATPPVDCAVCGDGIAAAPTEECDDGNTAGGDGCSPTCQLEDSSALCDGVPAVPGTALAKVLVASGLTQPLYVTAPPLDPSRLFIVEKGGTIRVVQNGALLPTPFLDLSGELSTGVEQGLLGVAFDPDYERNGYFYVSFTAPASPFTGICAVVPPGGGDDVIARYQVSGDPDVADASTKTVLLTVDKPSPSHNGGLIAFGPGGFLYAGIGDGTSGTDLCETAQDDLSPLGKLLRIDVTATPPIDPVTAIWAKGFRNPWRFSFDRATGDLYVGDVGEHSWEEVSYVAAPVPAGVDFQWDDREGRHCFEPAVACDAGGTPPVLEYPHGPGCAVTGGYVYRGCAMPDVRGTYFYTDYCDSLIRSFRDVSGGDAQSFLDHPELSPSLDAVVSFGEDARGELYLVDFGDIPGTPGRGEVWRIVPGS